MTYRQFFLYNVVGGFAWVTSMLFAGYFLGGLVEQAVRRSGQPPGSEQQRNPTW